MLSFPIHDLRGAELRAQRIIQRAMEASDQLALRELWCILRTAEMQEDAVHEMVCAGYATTFRSNWLVLKASRPWTMASRPWTMAPKIVRQRRSRRTDRASSQAVATRAETHDVRQYAEGLA